MTQVPLEIRVDEQGTPSFSSDSGIASNTVTPKLVLVKPFQEEGAYDPSLPFGEQFGEIRYMENGLSQLLERLQRAQAPLVPETRVVSLEKQRTSSDSGYPYGILMQDAELQRYSPENGHIDETVQLIGRLHAHGIVVSKIELARARREERDLALEIFGYVDGHLVLSDWTMLTLVDQYFFLSSETTEARRESSKRYGHIHRLCSDFDALHGFGSIIQPFVAGDEGRRRAALYLEAFKAAADPALHAQYADFLPRTLFKAFWKEGRSEYGH